MKSPFIHVSHVRFFLTKENFLLVLLFVGHSKTYRPRARTLLITRLRPKGLKVVPEPKFYADFKNSSLNCRKWGDLGEKVVF